MLQSVIANRTPTGELQYFIVCSAAPSDPSSPSSLPPPPVSSFVPIKPKPGASVPAPPAEVSNILELLQPVSSQVVSLVTDLTGENPQPSTSADDQCVLCTYRLSDTKDKKRAVFKFPKDAVRRKKWVDVCRQGKEDFELRSASFVCQQHFAAQYFRLPLLRNGKERKRLTWFAVPSLTVATAEEKDGADAECEAGDEDMECLNAQMRVYSNGLPNAVDVPFGPSRLVIPSQTLPSAEEKENLCGSSIYCPECEIFGPEPCWQHTKRYKDRQTVPLAKASLPSVLRFIAADEYPDAPTGVSARSFLHSHSVFGPMRGVLCSRMGGKFIVPGKDYRQCYHLESDYACNWMKYVHFADDPKEQNVAVAIRDNQIFFVTTKDIKPGTELKLCYSQKYAETVGTLPRHPLFGKLVHHVAPAITSDQNIPISQEVLENAPTALLEQNSNIPVVDHENNLVCGVAVDAVPICDGADEPDIPDRSLSPEIDSALHEPGDTEDEHAISVEASSDVVPYWTSDAVLFKAETFCGNDCCTDLTEKGNSRKRKRKEIRAEAVKEKRPQNCSTEATASAADQPNPTTELGIPKLVKVVRMKVTPSAVDLNDQAKELGIPLEKLKSLKRIRPKPVSAETGKVVSKFFRDPTALVKYPCEICRKHFQTEALMQLHQRFHDDATEPDGNKDTGDNVCPDCSERFESLPDLFKHVEGHGKPYTKKEQCPVCKKFIVAHLLSRHMKGNHPSGDMDDAAEYTCDVCQQVFPSEIKHRAHIQIHKVPKCLICAEIFEGWIPLGRHALTHKQADGFHCPSCDATFATFRRLTGHYRNHHDVRSICTCTVCGKIFRNKIDLYQHMQIQHTRRDFSHECTVCGKKFRLRETMRNHVAFAHTVGGRQRMQQSQTKYLKKVNYVAPRKRMLLEEFPLKCDKCQVGFLREGRYLRHLNKFHPEMPLPFSGGSG
ncbi:PR domain zinc finger protein 15-like [Paramacrobiotus metropolitanus]|uniref:PR domain zinc finger protein 15-like n=1 Tax=Paramacrobiotus metropolitanus TaxID=2943436 RepID=UPI002445A461|nr:PR domain zinc finger protein 15-like [Paramacrobiotus metropolitanus]